MADFVVVSLCGVVVEVEQTPDAFTLKGDEAGVGSLACLKACAGDGITEQVGIANGLSSLGTEEIVGDADLANVCCGLGVQQSASDLGVVVRGLVPSREAGKELIDHDVVVGSGLAPMGGVEDLLEGVSHVHDADHAGQAVVSEGEVRALLDPQGPDVCGGSDEGLVRGSARGIGVPAEGVDVELVDDFAQH